MTTTSEAPASRQRDIAKLARPLRFLIYLGIAVAIVELYHQASTLVLQLTNILLIFMFAAVVAMLVTPVVDRIQGLPLLRGHRGAAVLVLYGAIVLVVGGAAALLAPTVIADASKLGQQVPGIEDAAQRLLDNVQTSLKAFGIDLTYKIPRGGASIGGSISPASLTQIGGLVSPVVNVSSSSSWRRSRAIGLRWRRYGISTCPNNAPSRSAKWRYIFRWRASMPRA